MGAGDERPEEAWLAVLVEAMADAVVVIDATANLVYANPAAESLFDHSLDDRRGTSVLTLLHPEDLDTAVRSLGTMMSKLDEAGDPLEVRVRTGTDDWCHVELVAMNRLEDERFGGLILSIRDITDRRAAERGRAAAERVLDHTFARNPVGLVLCTLDGRFVRVNPAFCRLMGRTESDLLAWNYQELTDADELDQELVQWEQLLAGDRQTVVVDKQVQRPDGSTCTAELTASLLNGPDGTQLIFGQWRDVTEQRELQRALEHRSLHDPLTGLANRALFADRVELARSRHRRYGTGMAVAFIDLDDFKSVNDALGHVAGDELLRAVAERLTTRFRATDTVARVGGDEFAVLLEESGPVVAAEQLAAEILALFDEPFDLGERRLRAGASVGVAPVGAGLEDHRGTEELVADADLAMYAAKQAGKGRWRSFRPSMRSRAASRLGIRERLEDGFAEEAVEVHYQPVLDTRTGVVVGLEALARWRHPDLGLLRPGDFLEVAEEMGLAATLDRRVLERVARDREGWRATAPHMLDLPVGVNVTVAEVGPHLEEGIDAFFASPGGAGARLFIDLTERALLANVDAVAATLERLRGRGIGVILDDFGVGYSSLSQLHRLPIGYVKLDRAFLASTASTGPDFIAAVVNLCTSLGLKVIAEGVETLEQHELVRGLDVAWAQGFFYAEPRGARAVADFVARASDQPAPPLQGAEVSGAVGPST